MKTYYAEIAANSTKIITVAAKNFDDAVKKVRMVQRKKYLAGYRIKSVCETAILDA